MSSFAFSPLLVLAVCNSYVWVLVEPLPSSCDTALSVRRSLSRTEPVRLKSEAEIGPPQGLVVRWLTSCCPALLGDFTVLFRLPMNRGMVHCEIVDAVAIAESYQLIKTTKVTSLSDHARVSGGRMTDLNVLAIRHWSPTSSSRLKFYSNLPETLGQD